MQIGRLAEMPTKSESQMGTVIARKGANRRVLVTGAGGFIGHHLVKRLKRRGDWVRGVDMKSPEFEPSPADEFLLLDMRSLENCERVVKGIEDVYALAADMGGIG